ncbi:MAG: hypothetical protein U1E21_06045 [Reyranellaceae bacterium]
MRIGVRVVAVVVAVCGLALGGWSHAQPVGKTEGSAFVHTPQSAIDVVERGQLALPKAATAGVDYLGSWKDRPATGGARVPAVLLLHGSSGLKLAAIAEWQKWLAGLGIASLAPDSFALPDRITYSSPVGRDVYERIHALRSSEVKLGLAALRGAPWADPSRIALVGTSEGATAVARFGDKSLAARVVFAWSCEDNYFVEAHRTEVIADQPFLNVISSVDPFFSRSNGWLGNPSAVGHCAAVFAEAKRAAIVLVPGAPHTLINLPLVRALTRGFFEATFSP